MTKALKFQSICFYFMHCRFITSIMSPGAVVLTGSFNCFLGSNVEKRLCLPSESVLESSAPGELEVCKGLPLSNF